MVLRKRQHVLDPKRRAFWDDRMNLNVWYGVEVHRLLGSVNRLRKSLYQASVKKREEINALNVQPVSNIDEIP